MLLKFRTLRHLLLPCCALALSLAASAQVSGTQSSSSSSTGNGQQPAPSTSAPAPSRPIQPEASGSAVTLETSEPLFSLAVALNACGYDTDLANSNPIRAKIRAEVNDALTASPEGRDSRDALCGYIREHTLADSGRTLAQFVSLSLYTNPGAELTPAVGEIEMPPDATAVVNILPLLRTFAAAIRLHAIWIEHRPEYEALIGQVHDPLTRMILDANIYLRQPISSYDGRRFLVLLEPMLAPSANIASFYGNDYSIVASPNGADPAQVHMDAIRHTYLHYEIEPLVYARAAAMDRLLPLLKPVQNAPLDFIHKSDIVALLTECLIKAVEARTMDVGFPKPQRATTHQRADLERYDAELAVYDRQAEIVRRKTVDRDMRQGWVLVEYFYGKLAQLEHESTSLKEDIGEMVYGMDVDRERHHDEQIAFLPEGSSDIVRRIPQKPAGLRLAEMQLIKGDTDAAEQLAQKALADPTADHAEAHYILARINLMDRDPEQAIAEFGETLKTSKDPRTLAWSHIYLGRLYDIQSDRPKALTEYRAAMSSRDSQADTKEAAEKGIKQPFALPKRATATPDDDAPLDPSGKAEKEAYKPSNPN